MVSHKIELYLWEHNSFISDSIFRASLEITEAHMVGGGGGGGGKKFFFFFAN